MTDSPRSDASIHARGNEHSLCERVQRAASALVDERLSPRARDVVEAHARDCPHCLRILRDQLELSRRIRSLPRRPQPNMAALAESVRARRDLSMRQSDLSIQVLLATVRKHVVRHRAKATRWAAALLLPLLVTGTLCYRLGFADGQASVQQTREKVAPATSVQSPAGASETEGRITEDPGSDDPDSENRHTPATDVETTEDRNDEEERPLNVPDKPVPAHLSGHR